MTTINGMENVHCSLCVKMGNSNYFSCTDKCKKPGIDIGITADRPDKGIGDINSNEKGSGARYNTGKPAMELIPVWIIARQARVRYFTLHKGDPDPAKKEALEILHSLGEWQKGNGSLDSVFLGFHTITDLGWQKDCAAVFAYGAKKYAAWNWIKGMNWSIPVACIVRHALAILNGEVNDPESGLPHRGHIACNLVMLAQYEKTFPEGNDQPREWLNPVDNSTKSS